VLVPIRTLPNPDTFNIFWYEFESISNNVEPDEPDKCNFAVGVLPAPKDNDCDLPTKRAMSV
jgi:hypothetical protein